MSVITKEVMDRIFNECQKFFDGIYEMDRKQEAAKNSIAALREEAVKLKEQRPELLADGKSVTKINKRLKKIEEEIELNEDLIKGITAKKKSLDTTIYNTKIKRQQAFQGYIKGIMNKVAKEYREIAPKFAELVREFLLLEYMYNGSDRIYASEISYNDIKRIPSLSGNKPPLFEYKLYDLMINYDDVVREKYGIPEFEIRRIPRFEIQ